MMNSNNTSPVAANKRTCTWRWPPCDKWMQNNGNKLCASHNTRFNNGELPGDPTAVAATDTAATIQHTTTTTTATANTKKKKKKKEKNTKKKKEKKVKKGKSALKKRKKRAEKEQNAKKAHKANNAAEKTNVKERDDDGD